MSYSLEVMLRVSSISLCLYSHVSCTYQVSVWYVFVVTLVMVSSSCHSCTQCHPVPPLQKAPDVTSPLSSEKKPGTVDLCESVQKRVSNTPHHTPQCTWHRLNQPRTCIRIWYVHTYVVRHKYCIYCMVFIRMYVRTSF